MILPRFGCKHDNGNLATAGTLAVGGVTRIEADGLLVQRFALLTHCFSCHTGLGTAVYHHRDLWIFLQVVIPGRVVVLPPIGGNDYDIFAVWDADEGHGTGLAAFGPGGGEDDDGQASEQRSQGKTAVTPPIHGFVQMMQ